MLACQYILSAVKLSRDNERKPEKRRFIFPAELCPRAVSGICEIKLMICHYHSKIFHWIKDFCFNLSLICIFAASLNWSLFQFKPDLHICCVWIWKTVSTYLNVTSWDMSALFSRYRPKPAPKSKFIHARSTWTLGKTQPLLIGHQILHHCSVWPQAHSCLLSNQCLLTVKQLLP